MRRGRHEEIAVFLSKLKDRWQRLIGKGIQVLQLPPWGWPRFILGWLQRKNQEIVPCVFPGTKCYVKVDRRDYFESHSFFSESPAGRSEMAFFLARTRPDEIVFDIGGFRGAYAAAVKAAWGMRSKVFIFEPLPENFKRIEKLKNINNFNSFILVPKAVGSGFPLNGCLDKANGMLQAAGAGGFNPQNFSTLSVDGFCLEHQIQPTLIKVDVEGFEWEVLQGASFTLKNFRPRLWLELHPGYLLKTGKSWDSVTNLLKSWGYHLYFHQDFNSSNREVSFHVWCE